MARSFFPWDDDDDVVGYDPTAPAPLPNPMAPATPVAPPPVDAPTEPATPGDAVPDDSESPLDKLYKAFQAPTDQTYRGKPIDDVDPSFQNRQNAMMTARQALLGDQTTKSAALKDQEMNLINQAMRLTNAGSIMTGHLPSADAQVKALEAQYQRDADTNNQTLTGAKDDNANITNHVNTNYKNAVDQENTDYTRNHNRYDQLGDFVTPEGKLVFMDKDGGTNGMPRVVDSDGNVVKDVSKLRSRNKGMQVLQTENGLFAFDPATGQASPITSGGAVGNADVSGSVGGKADNTRAARNNNPGNLRYDGHSQWQGMTGVDKDGFVIFDTPANGQRALGINIQNQARLHGIDTVEAYVHKYAPAGDNNNEGAYANAIRSALGVQPGAKVNFADPAIAAKMAAVQTGVESGGTPSKFANGAQAGSGSILQPLGKPTKYQFIQGADGLYAADPKTGQATKVDTPFNPKGGNKNQMSPKDVMAAQTRLGIANRIIQNVSDMKKLDDGGHLWTGYFGGKVQGNTPIVGNGDTDRYDTLLSTVRNSITSLTRIPGIGSQSDYEARLAAATMPERTRTAAGRQQSYEELLRVAQDMRNDLMNQLKPNQGSTGSSGGSSSGWGKATVVK